MWLIILKARKGFNPIWLGGFALAIGVSIRYSELIFEVPAVLFLLLEKRIWHYFFFLLSFAVFFIFINGLSDKLYWGEPFYSLKNLFEFTFVHKLSSRGFEPFYFYVTHFGFWLNFLFISLALYSAKYKLKYPFLWGVVPLATLNLFPHKEPRYVIPVIPFFAMMAALSFWSLWMYFHKREYKATLPLQITIIETFLSTLLIVFIIQSHKDPKIFFCAFICFSHIVFNCSQGS